MKKLLIIGLIVGLVVSCGKNDITKSKGLGKIAFLSGKDNQICQIWLMDADGENQTKLTDDYAPKRWSFSFGWLWLPDGKKIAYASTNNEQERFYAIDIDDKTRTNLTDEQVEELNKRCWSIMSPDGKKDIIKTTVDGKEGFYITDSECKTLIRLSNKLNDSCFSWSPDGKKIAFASFQDDKHEIYIMDADGKNHKRLTNNKTGDWSPTWSPDGSKIAFVSDRNGQSEIYLMDIEGKNQTRLTYNYGTGPAWQPFPKDQ